LLLRDGERQDEWFPESIQHGHESLDPKKDK
jgi:hypothetical protein